MGFMLIPYLEHNQSSSDSPCAKYYLIKTFSKIACNHRPQHILIPDTGYNLLWLPKDSFIPPILVHLQL